MKQLLIVLRSLASELNLEFAKLVRRYLNLELPAYRAWWKYHSKKTQELLDLYHNTNIAKDARYL